MRKQKKSILNGVLFTIITLILFLPGVSFSGSLEPSDPPGPTMHTLEELYNKPVWKMFDKAFVDWPANSRFAVSDNGTPDDQSDDMVLDKETGLIWERDPSAKGPADKTLPLDWALLYCNERERFFTEHRDGWRLPTLQELASLIDYSHWNPALPSGHPFLNVQTGFINNDPAMYWTATPAMHCERRPGNAVYMVMFNSGRKNCAIKDDEACIWCVRGGPGIDTDLILWVTK